MSSFSFKLLWAGLALATGASMSNIPFSGIAPTRAIYVAVGTGPGTGSESSPYHSIQAAVKAATPGTIIYIEPGTYNENVKVPSNRGGTPDAPIWLAAKDGPGTVQIIASDVTKPVIQCLGVDNYVIKDLGLSGGYDGVQFSQSGRDFTDMVSNVVIEGNTIHNVAHDGVKVGQANNVYVGGNTISSVASEEGIDFVAVTNAVIEGNELSDLHNTTAAIFAKGGSTNIRILDNYIHGVTGDGISAGGNTDATSFKPGYTGYEAKNVVVSGNRIEDVGKQPVSVRGAIDVTVSGNYLQANADHGDAVYITTGNPRASVLAYSSGVSVTDNVLSGVATLLKIDPGNELGLTSSGNTAGDWNHVSGPASVTHDNVVGVLGAHDVSSSASVSSNGSGPAGNSSIVPPSAVPSTPAADGSVATSNTSSSDSLNSSSSPSGNNISFASSLSSITVNLMTAGKNTGDAAHTNLSSAHNITGTSFDDTLNGSNSADVLTGGAGNDRISGKGGADTLVGGNGDDTLSGNGGNDHIVGGAGNDMLSGGVHGSDWFAYDTGSWGNDTITDFENDVDKLDFRGSGLTFDDLQISQLGGNTIIAASGHESSITLQHIAAAQVNAADFLFG